MEAHVTALGMHAARRPDVALADLHEAAARAERAQRCRDHARRCQRVEHVRHALAPCERVDLVRVRRAARVERIAHAAIAKQGALARSARRAYDVRAERAQHLERGESDSAGRRLHEYARLRRGFCRARQRHVDRHEHRRRRRRGGERNHVRLACRSVHRRARVRAQAAGRQTQQRLACMECARRQRRHGHSHAGAVGAGRTRVAGVHAEHVQHVAEVDSHSHHAQCHGVRAIGYAQRVERVRLEAREGTARHRLELEATYRLVRLCV
mmetsp:Transcript_15195/g.38338  ORF Transcript_15195/g.38338 Transcript_15195/m.38338 type:complete len:268 (-) Transcript_15195:142-945(-)